MPRPRKWRNVCSLPVNKKYGPLGIELDENNSITLTIDEYEALRLIDLEGYNQTECATQMHVARTTVQGIYIEGRRKTTEALVDGRILLIEGGDYRICEDADSCNQQGCRGHGHGNGPRDGSGPRFGMGRGKNSRNRTIPAESKAVIASAMGTNSSEETDKKED